MQQQGNQSKQIEVKEIRRQKVFIPAGMTTKQIMKKYGLKVRNRIRCKEKGIFHKELLASPGLC